MIAVASNLIPVTSVWASGSADGDDPKNVIDGTRSSKWSAFGNPSWIILDFARPYFVQFLRMGWHRGESRIYNFTVEASNDLLSWTPIFSGSSSGITADYEDVDVEDANCRYIRVTVKGNSENDWASISELKPFGGDTPADLEAVSVKLSVGVDKTTCYESELPINISATIRLNGQPLVTSVSTFINVETTPRQTVQTDPVKGLATFSPLTLPSGNHKVLIVQGSDKSGLVKSTVSFTIKPASPPHTTLSKIRYYIPMYSKAMQDFAISLDTLQPMLRKVCAINPCSGPGNAFRQDIFDLVKTLKRNPNNIVICYIPTHYADQLPTNKAGFCWPIGSPRDLAMMHTLIDRALQFYPDIDGFMLDEQNSGAVGIPFYQDMRTYANQKFAALGKPAPYFLGNPGTDCDVGYKPIMNNIHIWEKNAVESGVPSVSYMQGVATKFGTSQIGFIPYALATYDQNWFKSVRQYLVDGTVYVTDHGITDDPWMTPASYWQSFIELLWF